MLPKEKAKIETLIRPQNLEDLRGKPKRLYKLLKNGLLFKDDLDTLHALAFPNEVFDDENDLHLEMNAAVYRARIAFQEAEALEREQAKVKKREAGAAHLAAAGLDPKTVPDAILEEIGGAVEQAEAAEETDEPVTIMAYDEEELAFVSPSGEIVGFANAPRDDLERRNILEWVGERLVTAQARQAGIEAEKNVWQQRIDRQFNPGINKQRRIVARLKDLYTPVGQAYLDELVKTHKGKTALRSAKVGLLTLQYTKTSARVDIVDEVKAIAIAEREFPDAIKTVKSILKSEIPADKKKLLTEKLVDRTGIFCYPGGEDKFDLK